MSPELEQSETLEFAAGVYKCTNNGRAWKGMKKKSNKREAGFQLKEEFPNRLHGEAGMWRYFLDTRARRATAISIWTKKSPSRITLSHATCELKNFPQGGFSFPHCHVPVRRFRFLYTLAYWSGRRPVLSTPPSPSSRSARPKI